MRAGRLPERGRVSEDSTRQWLWLLGFRPRSNTIESRYNVNADCIVQSMFTKIFVGRTRISSAWSPHRHESITLTCLATAVIAFLLHSPLSLLHPILALIPFFLKKKGIFYSWRSPFIVNAYMGTISYTFLQLRRRTMEENCLRNCLHTSLLMCTRTCAHAHTHTHTHTHTRTHLQVLDQLHNSPVVSW